MTNQEIFNTVARHLFAQGKQSMRPDGDTCAYRGVGRLRCAIGCLLPDKGVYTPRMEGSGIGFVMERFNPFPAARKFFANNDIELLQELQQTHDLPDNWSTTREMQRQLKKTATMYDLDHKVLNGFTFGDR